MIKRMSTLAIVLPLLSMTSGVLAQAALPSDEEAKVMAPSAVEKVAGYVRYWFDQLQTTEKVDTAMLARTRLGEGYRAYAHPAYRQAYAAAVARGVGAVLALDEPLKQLQASMAVSGIDNVAVAPALEAMIAHRSAGVRYWAVVGYVGLAPGLSGEGGEGLTKMVEALQALAARPATDGPVLSAVLRALVPPAAAKPEAAAAMRGAFGRVWRSRLHDLVAGSEDAAGAYQRSAALTANQPDKKAVMSLLLDALDAAGRGFEKNHPKDSLVVPYVQLLLTLEDQLAAATGSSARPIQKAMAAGGTAEVRALSARLAINDEWKPALKKLGVEVSPLPEPPAPTTATAPATGTAPARP